MTNPHRSTPRRFKLVLFKGQLYFIFNDETQSCCRFEQGGMGQGTVLLFVSCFRAKELPVIAGEVGT